ncbi:hypothetical protein FJ251_07415 [bacterium]|nr:hypothetical protein [bacterium]
MLRRRLAFALAFLGLAQAVPRSGSAAAAPAPPVAAVLRDDAAGLSLRLRFSPAAVEESDLGSLLRLAGCNLESADPEAPTAPGAPLLPRWRAQFALPPESEAQLTWQLLASEPLAGEPLPFPTLRPASDPQAPPSEDFQRDAAAFARSRPLALRLGALRQLRDLRVQELIVDPVAWDPERGLRLASELLLTIRFQPRRSAPDGELGREPLRRPDPLFTPVYAGALLNGAAAARWAERRPAAAGPGLRAGRAQPALELQTATPGLYGLDGAALAAWDIPLGTPLAEIALWRQRFAWDGSGQPDFQQLPVPRYFLDRDSDGLLDADDTLVFIGDRLATAPASPDALEWYGRAASFYVGRAPSLASEMPSASGWSEGESWSVPAHFERRRAEHGESYFLANPPSVLYNAATETWANNLYYFPLPVHGQNFTLDLAMASPGALVDSSATLRLHFQGTHNTTTAREFAISVINDGGTTALPICNFSLAQAIHYSATVPAGALADGDNTLRVQRINSPFVWLAVLQDWELLYDSRYVAQDDSLAFDAGELSGAVELRVEGLSGAWSGWQLLRLDPAGGAPVRIALGAANASGVPGDYRLSFRDQLAGGERWLLADAGRLRAPSLLAPADLAFLDEAAPVDALAICHEEFLADMQRWADWREGQGYRVELIGSEAVWDAFGGGARGIVPLRNAARFAYQQWGTAALLLVGDGSKDARGLGANAMPDFIPVFSRQEDVLGAYEMVALEEAVAKFSPNAWPSLLVGRLPVGDASQLAALLDKLECYEAYTTAGACAGGGEWRGDFLHVADDCWIWEDYYEPFVCKVNEGQFEVGQAELLAFVAAENLTRDFRPRPFYLSALTDPWFAAHPTAILSEVQTSLRPILAAAFTDSLSQGWGFVSVQSHANRNQLGHEEYFKTNYGADDQLLLANAGRPFVWALYGCHGNTFSLANEGSLNAGDCMGEKLLFLGGGRGAVASYASEGYEYLFPNIDLERQLIHLLFATDAASGAAADWRLGTLQLASELRYGQYVSSYRYNLLGDPLTRIDRSPPRLRLFADRQELKDGDFIPTQSPGDTLVLQAMLLDETRQTAPVLADQLGPLESELAAAWVPFHADTALLDSLIATTDTTLVELAVPVDSALAAAGGGARGWLLEAAVPYAPERDYLALRTRDQADREGRLTLWAAKVVDFFSASGDSLRSGQWVRGAGRLAIRIRVPSTTFQPESFSLFEDGALRPEISAVFAGGNPDTTVYLMECDYAWSPGEHTLEVRHDGEQYDGIRLVVDSRARLLEGLVFPNPFRVATTFRYALTGAVREGTLSIYTLSGRRIYHRRLEEPAEGETRWLSWDGRDDRGDPIANGVYLLRLVFTDLAGEELVWEDKVVRMR